MSLVTAFAVLVSVMGLMIVVVVMVMGVVMIVLMPTARGLSAVEGMAELLERDGVSSATVVNVAGPL